MAKEDVGNLKAKVGMDNVEFNKGIAAISQQMKIVSQDFKNASAGLDKVKDSAELSRLNFKKLSDQIGSQKKIVDEFANAHQKAVEKFGAGSKQALDYELKLKKAQGTLQGMTTELKKVGTELDNATKKQGLFSSATEKMHLTMNNVKTAFGVVGAAAGAYLTGAIGSAVKAEVSTARLTNLIQNQGFSLEEAKAKAAEFTKEITSMSAFSGGEAKEALQVLINKGIDVGKALEMESTLANIAAGANIELSAAADLMANAYNGKVVALVKLGILSKEEVKLLGDSEDATLTMADVQQRLNDRYGGAAQAQLGTYTGQMKQMQNQMDSSKKAIGEALLPMLADLAKIISELVTPMAKFIKENPKFTAALLSIAAVLGILIGGASAIATIGAAMTTLGIGAGAAGVGLGALILPVLAVVAAIALIGVIVYQVIKHWDDLVLGAQMAWANVTGAIILAWDSIMLGVTAALTNIQTFITNTWNAIVATVTAVIEGFKTGILNIFNLMADGLGMIMTGLQDVFGGVWDLIIQIFGGAIILIIDLLTGNFEKLRTDAAGIWRNITMDFQKIWDGIKLIFSGAILAVTNVLKAAWTNISQISTTTWNNIKTGISNIWNSITSSVSSSVNNVKNSLVNGLENAWNYIKGIPSQASRWGRDIIDGLVDGITSIHIPMPHFDFSVNYRDIGSGVSFPVPSVDVDWYAKGGIFGNPTVIGVGEEGDEAVIPIAKLSGILADALLGLSQRQTAPVTTKSIQYNRIASETTDTKPINITLTLDGAVLSRQLYYMNKGKLRGAGA